MKLKTGKELHEVSPHIVDDRSTKVIMQDVVIAMIPALLGAIYFFGINALILTASSVATCVLSEYIWQRLRKEPLTVGDWSAVVTGMLIAFNVPATTPIWAVMIASVFAIIVVKQFFGGIGSNFANPALMGRALLMFLWPASVSSYVTTYHSGVDAVSSATVLGLYKSGSDLSRFSKWDMFIGNIPGCLGETSALLLLIGFAYLCYRKVVNLAATGAYIITVLAMTFVFARDGLFKGDILTNLLSGGLILGACFMMTDYASVAPRVKVVLSIIAGLVTAGIRLWGMLPEGVSYGILTANCLSGLVETVIRPHIYGVGLKKQKSKI
ncbi:MAG: RnfABCDGE type electron transport complex subunit D [Clostridiales bacterium]|jgi:electron transport complex protein RnfD|nr:RnfABCDGE type electron transport complex subunit D [Clostridiales bacterium]